MIAFSLRNLRYLSLSRNIFTPKNLTDFFFFSNQTVSRITQCNCFHADFEQFITSWHLLIPTNRRSSKHRVEHIHLVKKQLWVWLVNKAFRHLFYSYTLTENTQWKKGQNSDPARQHCSTVVCPGWKVNMKETNNSTDEEALPSYKQR